MINIDYQHKISPSFQSKLIQASLYLFRIKKKIERKMITGSFKKDPAKLPDSLVRNFNINVAEHQGRRVWTISDKLIISKHIILYLHGGAYLLNITKEHWSFVEKLVRFTKSTIVIPDYPLAPEGTYKEAYDFIGGLYTSLTIDHPTKCFIFMGDSAGGGLALGFAQQLRNNNKKQPCEIIIFSPWLDITMSNPDIKFIEKQDNLLSSKGLKTAGQKYAGELDLKDYRLSPVYGDFAGMCRISIFTGSSDILFADAYKFKLLLSDQNINFNYFEYPKMFHAWVLITSLKESVDVINKVVKIINENED